MFKKILLSQFHNIIWQKKGFGTFVLEKIALFEVDIECIRDSLVELVVYLFYRYAMFEMLLCGIERNA